MQIGTVFGFPLLQMPAAPGNRQADWSYRNKVARVANPFNFKTQIQNWQAGAFAVTVTMPPMQRSLAAAWDAFLAESQGGGAVFMFGDGLGNVPQGTAEGSPVTEGSFQQPNLLTTLGWAPNQPQCLVAGDWINIALRLYKVTADVAVDANGNAAIPIWPQVREQPSTGTGIITTNPQGLFRMASNDLNVSLSYLRTYGISFSIEEALF